MTKEIGLSYASDLYNNLLTAKLMHNVSEYMTPEKRADIILKMNVVECVPAYCCQHQTRRKDRRSLLDSTETANHRQKINTC